MTTEEKARAYDKALKRAREVIKNNQDFVRVTPQLMEEIFPELKESEDEMIKKSLIDYFDRFKSGDMWNESFSFGDVIAWIEKQGEQKPTCLLDNSESNVKFPFKAKVKSNGKIVTIRGGQLNKDCKEWVKYQSNVEDGYKVYEPKDLELVYNVAQELG